mgnify:CR=1 FL=1
MSLVIFVVSLMHMKLTTYIKTTFFLSLAGSLFAGYLAGVKLFSGTCAFNETCPYFLGYPACFFGFGLFFSIFLVTTIAWIFKITKYCPVVINAVISFLGILFAGYFTAFDIFAVNFVSPQYERGLPTCFYGFIFFVLVFVITLVALFRRK